ncbi:MAG TPA: carboxypeptidase-like regulatory domain-containing protein, partial [Acidimicrobiales bacterium]|nr:carboxypeptidase-like regulatory domain-containing protein [Acidimicrobiales bacterium]
QQSISIFGSDTWGSLSPFPTLLPYGKEMVVVFDGTRGTTGPYSQGCIVVATSAKPTWVLEPWSLSQDCVGNNGGATVTRNGTLSAAWISGNQIDYRVGVSQTIPPGTPDSYFSVPGHGSPDSANVVTDLAGSDDVYAAWNQNDSSPATDNGFWVKDLMGGSAMKAPGSGLNSVSNFPEFSELVPLANTNTHGGVFIVYCSNASTCSLLLWRVGAKKPLVVPGSYNALDAAISAGPDGRIWVAWANRSSNDVSTVRTNTADTAFGPVETYATPCGGGPALGLTGGDYGRLDIVMTCVNTADKDGLYVTQSLAGLSLTPSRLEISAGSSNTIEFGVSDAGDPVAGATVRVDGKTATTNAKGNAFFSFPKGSSTGHFTVTASALNYYSAHATLDIVS